MMSEEHGSETDPPGQHPNEPHNNPNLAQRLNWLRAGVLGANDGIVSVAAIAVGVAGATSASGPILTAGLAALVGGMVSMALGEYVSVSSQRDSQRALIAKERRELENSPEEELRELAGLYQAKGLSTATARQVAQELTDNNALKAHLSVELDIDENDVVSPWNAAFASAVSFVIGGVLPLIAILLPPQPVRVPLTFAVVLVALAITGSLGAYLGDAPRGRATIRTLIGGTLALAATYGIGTLLHTQGIG
jgi:VIT1/CCC1 family predicted Fe2+/Mn2+ transporter